MMKAVMQKIDSHQGSYFEIKNYLDSDYREEIIRDINEGMSRKQKTIPCKYFYDAYGSRLFEKICYTPEYYLTRAELAILDDAACEIVTFFADDWCDIVELGSGSNGKIRKLFDAINVEDLCKIRYVPVDISEFSIKKTSREIIERYKNLRILGVVADYTRHLKVLPSGRKLIVFFGSTIGNFTEDEAIAFLNNISDIMTPDDRFLLGLDMLKPASIIESAYNDETGLTGKFNLNVLSNINRELNADFNLQDFNHLAFFDREKECVEMHIEAKRSVRVQISDLELSVDFKKGETIHTETCNKFSRESASSMFKKASLAETGWFTNPTKWFSLVELKTTKGS
jgi:L-histidine N-alpha-methyltransferase